MKSRVSKVLLGLLLLPALSLCALAASCPSGTFYIGEDAEYLYCKRENEALGDDRATRAALIRNAMTKIGIPYHLINDRCPNDLEMCPVGEHRWGCLDCSSLTQEVLQGVGIEVPRSADQQYRFFKSIPQGLKSRADLLPGDLIFFGDESKVVHVGFYMGSRRSDGIPYYLRASTKKGRVVISKLHEEPFAFGNIGVLRVKRH